MGGGLEGQTELLPRGPGRRGDLLGPVAMALQRLGGEVMPGEHALDPAVIDGIMVAVSDNPRLFASGEGMGQGRKHDELPDAPGQEHVRTGLPPRMRQGAPTDQAQEPIAPKAPQIPPQPPLVDPSLLTLLSQGPLALENRANSLIAANASGYPTVSRTKRGSCGA